MSDDLLLPARGRLLHIGPHKTGTSTLQAALHATRPTLADHGVVYAGEGRQQYYAAAGVAGHPFPHDLSRRVPREYWERLVDEVASYDDERVVISSEAFCEAGDAAARETVRGLGGDHLHVLVTLRPLAAILPSAWQQYLRNRLQLSYDEWLVKTLDGPPDTEWGPFPFWIRHRHDELVQRWADIVGPERVTVVMVDGADRERILRVVEGLVGLPDGLLRSRRGTDNRSSTVAEAEAMLRVNRFLHDGRVPDPVYHALVGTPFVRAVRRRKPGPDEPRIVTPDWALDRAAGIGAAAAEAIRTSNVRVIGDLDLLATRPDTIDPATDPAAATLPAPTVAAILLGSLTAAADGIPELSEKAARDQEAQRARITADNVDDKDTGTIARELAHRITRRARSRITRLSTNLRRHDQ